MHDEKHSYCIVYDKGDPNFDPLDPDLSDMLLMSTWDEILRDKPWGLIEPVLVTQFLAPSWEEAMQQWNNLRGFGPYTVNCLSQQHRGNPTVRWVDDDYRCWSCVVYEAIHAALQPFVGKSLASNRETIKVAVTHALHKLHAPPISLSSFTVSTEKDNGGTALVVWASAPHDKYVREVNWRVLLT